MSLLLSGILLVPVLPSRLWIVSILLADSAVGDIVR